MYNLITSKKYSSINELIKDDFNFEDYDLKDHEDCLNKTSEKFNFNIYFNNKKYLSKEENSYSLIIVKEDNYYQIACPENSLNKSDRITVWNF